MPTTDTTALMDVNDLSEPKQRNLGCRAPDDSGALICAAVMLYFNVLPVGVLEGGGCDARPPGATGGTKKGSCRCRSFECSWYAWQDSNLRPTD